MTEPGTKAVQKIFKETRRQGNTRDFTMGINARALRFDFIFIYRIVDMFK
jgi:hypothetical protein